MKRIISVGFIAMALFTSCVSNKKTQSIKAETDRQKRNDIALLQRLDSIESKSRTKFANGELDDKTDSTIHSYIKELRDSIRSRMQHYDALASTGFKRKREIERAKAYYNYVSGLYKADLENIVFFDELLAANTFAKLNTAVFFAPGEYRVSDNATAENLLRDVVNAVLDFSAKHSQYNLYASFVIVGYADEQDYVPNSPLYKDLASKIATTSPSRVQMNIEMSNRRANAITGIIRTQYRLNRSNYPNSNLLTSFFSIGKGEQLPAGNITDYKPIDERRRIVLIYWSVLPRMKK